ncbi:MAG TPA: hypothetical protein VMN36_02735 [Verrucomicrobiales bacterium]|nr:hypothetical protein [Verrucomicrobiales bacterium]
MDAEKRERLCGGEVVPACPLALENNGRWAERHQRALVRYYAEAGAGGLAVGVHSTQFEIRDPRHGLFEPVLELAAREMEEWPPARDMIRVAGICGDTEQALREAAFVQETGYDLGLVSPAAFRDASDEEFLNHCRSVAEVMPVMGFYLQEAVGGRRSGFGFWRKFFEIPGVVAVKVAPFDRYATLEVVRAVVESGRDDVALYTGNDDHILGDLITPFRFGDKVRYFAGGLLGQWGVWTRRAVEQLRAVQLTRPSGEGIGDWLEQNVALTDANAAVFDASNGFRGCLAGILEVLRRQGLAPSRRCLSSREVLSPGQAEEIDRVCRQHPQLTDDDFVKENLSRWLG